MNPPSKAIRFKWVTKPGPTRDRLYNVGIDADGSLINPNGYDEDLVREAVIDAIERQRQRRSSSAKKAAATRARRRERKITDIVSILRAGGHLSAAHACRICRKALGDPESIARGIGSDCWQDVLAELPTVPPTLLGAQDRTIA